MKNMILRIQNLRVKYKNAIENALDGISLHLFTNDCIVISGKIGSGKSTLLRAIAKQFPPGILEMVEGIIDNEHIPGIVYQRPKSQIITFRVDEELATSLSFSNIPRTERFKILKKYMESNNILPMASKDPRILSSGEQQSIVIHSTLIRNSAIILLDEPLALLDNDNRLKVLKLIKSLRNKGHCLVIVDHNPIDYMDIANKLLVLDAGKCQFYGEFNNYIDNYKLKLKEINDLKFKIKHSKNYIWSINVTIGYNSPLQKIVAKFPDRGLILVYGPNGSGKTLFLLTIIGFKAQISGNLNMPRNFIFLEQDTFSFFSRKRVIDEWDVKQPIPHWLDSLKETSPFLLSEGERKKFALEICISQNRPILLDEPSQGLDLPSIKWICDKIAETSQNQLIIVSSNDSILIQVLRNFATDVIKLNKELNVEY